MIKKTQGIVLSFVKYSDTSIIVKIYTRDFGLHSYIINGIRSKKARPKIALYQPLVILDMEVYFKENQNISRISESRCLVPLTSISFEHRKTCIAMFMGEILNKCLREESSNESMFDFISSSIQTFDKMKDNYENFHLQFLVGLAGHLGFALLSSAELVSQTDKSHAPSPAIMNNIDALIDNNYSQNIKLTNASRREILDLLLSFYAQQIENFGQVRSLAVLQEVLG